MCEAAEDEEEGGGCREGEQNEEWTLSINKGSNHMRMCVILSGNLHQQKTTWAICAKVKHEKEMPVEVPLHVC